MKDKMPEIEEEEDNHIAHLEPQLEGISWPDIRE